MTDRLERSGHRYGWVLLGLAVAAGPALAARPVSPAPAEQLAHAGGRTAWRLTVPLSFVDSIEACHLVDEYLFQLRQPIRRSVDDHSHDELLLRHNGHSQ